MEITSSTMARRTFQPERLAEVPKLLRGLVKITPSGSTSMTGSPDDVVRAAKAAPRSLPQVRQPYSSRLASRVRLVELVRGCVPEVEEMRVYAINDTTEN